MHALPGLVGEAKANCLAYLGHAYYRKGAFSIALGKLNKALDMRELDQEKRKICATLMNLAFEGFREKKPVKK